MSDVLFVLKIASFFFFFGRICWPSPPYLEYKYPELNDDIGMNILNALHEVPQFYIQVLHLMNKMHLPPPFSPPPPGMRLRFV